MGRERGAQLAPLGYYFLWRAGRAARLRCRPSGAGCRVVRCHQVPATARHGTETEGGERGGGEGARSRRRRREGGGRDENERASQASTVGRDRKVAIASIPLFTFLHLCSSRSRTGTGMGMQGSTWISCARSRTRTSWNVPRAQGRGDHEASETAFERTSDDQSGKKRSEAFSSFGPSRARKRERKANQQATADTCKIQYCDILRRQRHTDRL